MPETHIEDRMTPIKKAPRRRFKSADIPAVGTKEISFVSWDRSIYAASVVILDPRASPAGPNPSRKIARMFVRPKRRIAMERSCDYV